MTRSGPRLQKQIDEFRNRATIEAARMEAVRLERRRPKDGRTGTIKSKWFSLDSTADEQNTRRVDRSRRADLRRLPPDHAAARAACSAVAVDLAGLAARVPGGARAKLGVTAKFQNPACFIEDKNTVVIGSDLTRLECGDGPTGGPERCACGASCATWSSGWPSGSARSATRCGRAAFPTARWAAS